MALHTIDFTQAFTNAPQPNPHLYCELPDLPDELKGKICGGGKHELKVGHLKRWANHTVCLHQRAFAEALVKKYEPGSGRAAAMPYLTTKEQLIPQDTEAASESETFEYMCMIGDLTWYSRTNPGIAWRAADLARHMQNPEPDHIETAR